MKAGKKTIREVEDFLDVLLDSIGKLQDEAEKETEAARDTDYWRAIDERFEAWYEKRTKKPKEH